MKRIGIGIGIAAASLAMMAATAIGAADVDKAIKPKPGTYVSKLGVAPDVNLLKLKVTSRKVKLLALKGGTCNPDKALKPKIGAKIKRGKFSGKATVHNSLGTYKEKLSGKFTSKTEATAKTHTDFTAADPNAPVTTCQGDSYWSPTRK